MNQANADQLAYWINERYKMYLARSKGLPKPWTQDNILQHYRFCNVFRETDKVTKFIRQWAQPDQYLTPMTVLARLFNNIHTLQGIEWPQKMDKFWFDNQKQAVKIMRDLGNRIFNAAYIVSTAGQSMDKVDYVFDIISCVKHYEVHPTPGDSLASFAHRLRNIKGMGSFLVAQVVADLKNTPGNPLHEAEDWWTWNSPGPGSKRGLEWIYGVTPVADFNIRCQDLYVQEIRPRLSGVPNMCMQDFQNCLCEFDKWKRTKDGTGAPKQLYNGTGRS